VTDQPEQRDAGQSDAEQPDDARPEADWQRKRRLAEVFGDLLPDTTSDERDPAERSDDSADRGDTWLKEQVPPHHGG
jgi:hypothetical protein